MQEILELKKKKTKNDYYVGLSDWEDHPGLRKPH